MTITDVMCNLCFSQFLVGATVEVHVGNGKRSHVCHDCVDRVLAKLPVSGEIRDEVEKSWAK